MPNRLVIFPAAKLTEAEAYKAFGDAWYQSISTEPQGILGIIKTDAYGQHVTTYAGPPFTIDGINELAEPEGGPAMRADGVLADDWTPPPEEE